MRRVAFESEEEMAAIVVNWLREWQWTVYQEVDTRGSIIDIVATRGPLLRVVECKLTMSAALIEQARNHCYCSHYTNIAVPLVWRNVKGRRALTDLLRYYGIGKIEVEEPTQYNEPVRESLPARFDRRALVHNIRRHLNEKQQTWARAGNANGDRYTPFKDTCQRWERYVKQHPGCTLKQIIDAESHHYAKDSTARTAMVKWIREGLVKSIRIDEGLPMRLWPIGEENDRQKREG